MPSITLSIDALQDNPTKYLEQIKERPIVITQNGTPTAYLIDCEWYDALLQRLEDLEDLRDMEESLAAYNAGEGRRFRDYDKQHRAKEKTPALLLTEI